MSSCTELHQVGYNKKILLPDTLSSLSSGMGINEGGIRGLNNFRGDLPVAQEKTPHW